MLKQLQSYFRTIWTTFNRYMLWVPLAAILIVAGSFTWYQLELRPVQRQHVQIFRVEKGESARSISGKLESQGFIRNAYAFEIYITIHGQRSRLQTGTYSPPEGAGAKEIANMLATGKVNAKRLTVPEGSTLAKIRELAQAQGIARPDFDAELTAARASGAHPVLAQIPSGISMEGYLFPDTYTISGDTPAKDLVASMLANLESNLKQAEAGFATQGLTLHQGLTLASVVEKEVSGESDRKVVAGIFLNRLRTGQRLESDVTTIYAANLIGVSFSTALDSPYNTYRADGLPVGPICNPGLSALLAVANPTATDYHYFLSGKDGKTYFATTFAEHQQNIDKYLR